MYATILMKLFLNCHQHIIEEVNAKFCRIPIVSNLNISENKRVVRDHICTGHPKRVVRDTLKTINYLT